MQKSKVSLYIDGFNIYHRIDDYQKKTGICYKWLNYKSLFQSLLKPDEEIANIYFFTAITQDFGINTVQRHNKYITALESEGIEIVKGYFSKKRKPAEFQDVNSKAIDLLMIEKKNKPILIFLFFF